MFSILKPKVQKAQRIVVFFFFFWFDSFLSSFLKHFFFIFFMIHTLKLIMIFYGTICFNIISYFRWRQPAGLFLQNNFHSLLLLCNLNIEMLLLVKRNFHRFSISTRRERERMLQVCTFELEALDHIFDTIFVFFFF